MTCANEYNLNKQWSDLFVPWACTFFILNHSMSSDLKPTSQSSQKYPTFLVGCSQFDRRSGVFSHLEVGTFSVPSGSWTQHYMNCRWRVFNLPCWPEWDGSSSHGHGSHVQSSYTPPHSTHTTPLHREQNKDQTNHDANGHYSMFTDRRTGNWEE